MSELENRSYVDHLETLSAGAGDIQSAARATREAVSNLILPDAAKLLTAIALDKMTAVEARNDRQDVNDACAMLRAAIRELEEVDPGLDG